MIRIKNFLKKYHKIVQFIISSLILFMIMKGIDFSILYRIIISLDLRWYAMSIAIFAVSIVIVSYKWWKILRFQNFKYDFIRIFKINLIASFYNQFLPGRIGGDSIKIFYLIKNQTQSKGKLLMSVVVDRLFNLIGIILVAVYSLLTLKSDLNYLIIVISVFMFILIILTIVILTTDYVSKSRLSKSNLVKKILTTLASIKLYLNSIRKVTFMIWWGALYSVLTFVMNYFIGESLHLGVDLSYYLFFLPIVYLVTIIPISFGGLGIREGGYVYFLGLMGVGAEKALSLSLLTYFTVLFFSLPGYFILLIDSSMSFVDIKTDDKSTAETKNV